MSDIESMNGAAIDKRSICQVWSFVKTGKLFMVSENLRAVQGGVISTGHKPNTLSAATDFVLYL